MCALLALSPPPRHARTRREAAGRPPPSLAAPAWSSAALAACRTHAAWRPRSRRSPRAAGVRIRRPNQIPAQMWEERAPAPWVDGGGGGGAGNHVRDRACAARPGGVVRPPARARVCALGSLVPDSASKSADSVNTGTHARTDECEVRVPGRERPPWGPRPPAVATVRTIGCSAKARTRPFLRVDSLRSVRTNGTHCS